MGAFSDFLGPQQPTTGGWADLSRGQGARDSRLGARKPSQISAGAQLRGLTGWGPGVGTSAADLRARSDAEHDRSGTPHTTMSDDELLGLQSAREGMISSSSGFGWGTGEDTGLGGGGEIGGGLGPNWMSDPRSWSQSQGYWTGSE